jgi:hypothetical protein
MLQYAKFHVACSSHLSHRKVTFHHQLETTMQPENHFSGMGKMHTYFVGFNFQNCNKKLIIMNILQTSAQ